MMGATRFEALPNSTPDVSFALIAVYKADPSPVKVDLCPGFYRDEQGHPWVLPCVRKAKQILSEDPNADHEHLPLAGHPELLAAALKLVFDATDEDNKSIASVQTIAGTGSNHLGALLLAKCVRPRTVWYSNLTWPNHPEIWQLVDPNVERKSYPYFDENTMTLEFDGMISTLREQAKEGDVVILHGCAHNPTGLDMTKDQWKTVAQVCEEKRLVAFFDLAYQGFATGDLGEDAWAVRHFHRNTTTEVLVAQSFSKNFGLYGERAGVLHVVTRSETAKAKTMGMLARLSRAEITTPPINGARIIATVLSDDDLKAQWLTDLRHMSDRMQSMRKMLHQGLIDRQTPGRWDHLLTDIGMFSMLGITPAQVQTLIEQHHVYLLPSGRISVTGLTEDNVNHVADSIHKIKTA